MGESEGPWGRVRGTRRERGTENGGGSDQAGKEEAMRQGRSRGKCGTHRGERVFWCPHNLQPLNSGIDISKDHKTLFHNNGWTLQKIIHISIIVVS